MSKDKGIGMKKLRGVIMANTKSTVIFISDNQKDVHRARQWTHENGYQIKTFTSLQWKNGLLNFKFREQFLKSSNASTSRQVLTSGRVIPFPEPKARSGKRSSSANNPVPTINEIQKTAIQEAVQQFHGNLTKTSIALGIGRATLYRKVKLYKIDLLRIRHKRKTLKAA